MQRYGDSACMSHLNYVFFPIQSVALLYTNGPLCGQTQQLGAQLPESHLPPGRHQLGGDEPQVAAGSDLLVRGGSLRVGFASTELFSLAFRFEL